MLRRTPSLAFRASLIFMSVYAVILLSVVMIGAAISWADRGERNLRGVIVAVDYAAAELREEGGTLQLPKSGRFADLAARNPTLWLVAVQDGRFFTAGRVSRVALETVAELQTAVDTVVLRLPGTTMPMGAAAVQRRVLPFGSVVIAAGGVDPQTLSTRESIHLLLEPEIIFGLIGIAVISLLAMLVAVPAFTRALVPITQEAAAIGAQDPGRRLREDKAPAELLPLVRGFNGALDRLQAELGRRKRFIGDVAHELRTPLAVVSLQAESLPNGDSKTDLKRGLGRLTQLVGQMLDLERLSLSGQQHVPLDLVALARDVVADLAPIAIAKGYDLSLAEPGKPVMVSGEEHSISRALTNLVGNAIAYAGGTGAISVEVAQGGRIDVRDEGPGVTAGLQGRLFEPFVRGGSDGEGCGLGLHLTREIMRAHGGEVLLVPSVRGAAFSLAFPPPPIA